MKSEKCAPKTETTQKEKYTQAHTAKRQKGKTNRRNESTVRGNCQKNCQTAGNSTHR
uniref:Uncharacterized protein n=1 Tax=Anopheles funestus TaxID=62324 RepID=A0A182S4H7_ANOFN